METKHEKFVRLSQPRLEKVPLRLIIKRIGRRAGRSRAYGHGGLASRTLSGVSGIKPNFPDIECLLAMVAFRVLSVEPEALLLRHGPRLVHGTPGRVTLRPSTVSTRTREDHHEDRARE